MPPRNTQRGPETTASSQAVQPVRPQPGDEPFTPPAAAAPPATTAADDQPLRTDGPTLEEYVDEGYSAETYPPAGFAIRKATPAGAPAAERVAEQAIYAYPIPAEYVDRDGLELLMEACTLYGIDPDKEAHPVELLEWKYYKGDRRRRVPDRIVLVTAGGLKISHPSDPESLERLRRVFHCFKELKGKDGSVEIKILDLPEDLTLPRVNAHGQVPDSDHQFKRGYLKEGGATEAAKRAARRNAGLP